MSLQSCSHIRLLDINFRSCPVCMAPVGYKAPIEEKAFLLDQSIPEACASSQLRFTIAACCVLLGSSTARNFTGELIKPGWDSRTGSISFPSAATARFMLKAHKVRAMFMKREFCARCIPVQIRRPEP